MVFSAPIFLFGFLPFALILYYFSPKNLKNAILLVLSLLFYAWGEVFYIGVMLVSILSNYILGRLIGHHIDDKRKAKLWIALAVAVNLALLVSFKYANFIGGNFNALYSFFGTPEYRLKPVHLPLGISFFTFQAMSYVIDVYRREVTAQKNIYSLALYISLFPQLIAGPIVRYKDIVDQIFYREHSVDLFANGVRRFIYGLSKKVLIANALGQVADQIFSMTGSDLTMPLAWIGILAYSLQIYFDFSGYSDMAIGLGMMFGFKFLENFNYPYISKSIQDFWRRWHISLSTWFRDYVYISLGGNRISPARTYFNLLAVFTLTGFWHGASWNFLVWGLFHGFFIIIERVGLGAILKKLWAPFAHFYLLLVVMIGWVLFRAENLTHGLDYLYAMFDVSNIETSALDYARILSSEVYWAFAVGIILSIPVFPKTLSVLQRGIGHTSVGRMTIQYGGIILLMSLMTLCMMKAGASTYNPFIYFRF
ncbi:MAG: MBOAT family O-acyltransferase [Litorimonas sp.]